MAAAAANAVFPLRHWKLQTPLIKRVKQTKGEYGIPEDLTRIASGLLRFTRVEGSNVMHKSRTYFQQVLLEIAILKKQPDGSVHWVEAAMDIESAKERVQVLAECFPGEYVIVDRKKGYKINIRATDGNAVAGMLRKAVVN